MSHYSMSLMNRTADQSIFVITTFRVYFGHHPSSIFIEHAILIPEDEIIGKNCQ